MIILGIDPGSHNCGYGILEVHKRLIVAAGCDLIEVNARLPLAERLTKIYSEIVQIIKQYRPDVAVVESIFYGKNIQSAFILGQARGVILLALAQADVKIAEYSPREIKKSVVGNGSANKEQVQYMVQKILKLNQQPRKHDASDALAAALCYFNKEKFTWK